MGSQVAKSATQLTLKEAGAGVQLVGEATGHGDAIRAVEDIAGAGLDIMGLIEGTVNPVVGIASGIDLVHNVKDLFSLGAKHLTGHKRSYPHITRGAQRNDRAPSHQHLDMNTFHQDEQGRRKRLRPEPFNEMRKQPQVAHDIFDAPAYVQGWRPPQLRKGRRTHVGELPPDPAMNPERPLPRIYNNTLPYDHTPNPYPDMYYDTRVRYPNADVMPYNVASIGHQIEGADVYANHGYGDDTSGYGPSAYVETAPVSNTPQHLIA